jgi:FKBP-type peptidyl-prolyl cis-trans isomerase
LEDFMRYAIFAVALASLCSPLAVHAQAGPPAPAKPAANSPEGNQLFFAANGKKKGVVTTASGLQYQILRPGTGAKPTAENTVRVTYTGYFVNGQVFDQSKTPIEFPLGGVIRGWTEGLQYSQVGGRIRLWVPPAIGYGPLGSPPVIPPNAILVFDIELLEVR